MSRVGLKGKTILVTGAAGFIGSNLVKRLFNEVEDVTVIGIDNMNDYYDVRLKEARLEELYVHPSFVLVKDSIADKAIITEVFEKYKPQVVVNLAAQAGVWYSMGYYLSIEKNRILRNRKVVYSAVAISFAVMSIWDAMKIIYCDDYSHWIRKANFLIPPMAIAVFVFFITNHRMNIQEGRVLKSISRCSFGIYLIYPLYVNIFYKVLHIAPTSFPIVFGIAFLFVIVFAASWASAWIMTKIPMLNRII